VTALLVAPRPRSFSRLVGPALAIAYGAWVLAIGSNSAPPTTYASTSGAATAVDLAAGFGLIAAGALVLWVRGGGSIGVLAMLLGAVWLAPDWVGWDDGGSLVRSLAALSAPFLLPLAWHLVLAYPGGRQRGRAGVGLIYGPTAVAALGIALFRDPLLDINCWSNCTDNSFLVAAHPSFAHSLETAWLVSSECANDGCAATRKLLSVQLLQQLMSSREIGRAHV